MLKHRGFTPILTDRERHVRLQFLPLLSVMLVACPAAHYEDVSSESEFSGVVGRTFVTTTELMLHGINYDTPPTNDVQEYVLTNKPGIAGRGVVKSGILRPGVTITVRGVMRCTWCLYEGLKFSVTVDPPLPLPSVPVSLKSVGDEAVANEVNGKLRMNPAIFDRPRT